MLTLQKEEKKMHSIKFQAFADDKSTVAQNDAAGHQTSRNQGKRKMLVSSKFFLSHNNVVSYLPLGHLDAG